MPRPLIGVTLDAEKPGGYSKFPWYALRQNYLDAIDAAGGLPVALPHEPDRVADYLAAKPAGGGLGWGTGPVTAIGLVLFGALVAYVTLTGSDAEGTHDAALGLHGTDTRAVPEAPVAAEDASAR